MQDMGKRDRDEILCFHPGPLGGYKGKRDGQLLFYTTVQDQNKRELGTKACKRTVQTQVENKGRVT